MLGQRRRRWSNIETALGECLIGVLSSLVFRLVTRAGCNQPWDCVFIIPILFVFFFTELRSCDITPDILHSGLRVLYLQQGLFYEAEVREIQPPDV